MARTGQAFVAGLTAPAERVPSDGRTHGTTADSFRRRPAASQFALVE
jgi:hypothetical protein